MELLLVLQHLYRFYQNQTNNKVSGFKLLAIRPLKGCSKEFVKILKPGMVYSFYNDYNFIRENENDINSEINKIIYNPSLPTDFFNVNDIIINISAIVGKNGSGKSSIIDLFFAAIHVLSQKEEVLVPNLQSINNILKSTRIEIKSFQIKLENLNKTLNERKLSGAEHQLFLQSHSNSCHVLQIKIDNGLKEIRRLEELKKDIQRLNSGVKVEIFYELESNIYKLFVGKESKSKKNTSLKVIHGEKSILRDEKLSYLFEKDVSIDFEKLFYSIAISYSHYALNSNEIGPWINSLFHKNDGYQTPVVINPMRTNGIIDVNKEKILVNQRLLSNLLEPKGVLKEEDSLRSLAPGKTAKGLVLTLNNRKIEELSENKRQIKNSSELVRRLYFAHTGKTLNASVPDEPAFIWTELYIVLKLIKICETYHRYEKYLLDDEFDEDLAEEFINTLMDDSSHITFKLKQALNFLRFKIYWNWKNDVQAKINLEIYSSHIIDLKNELKSDRERFENFDDKKNKYLTIEFVPPSIFDIEIIMKDGSSFNDLSSGEKQRVYSLSTIGYHIMNINSVFDNGDQNKKNESTLGKSSNEKIIKYRNINILFDEVEQYFHPDFQRQFVGDLLDYLNKLNKDLTKNLNSINILFATHSPFILSDIPISNTLRIDEGKIQKIPTINTFGANIYDLLFDNFFMKDGFIGSFAMNKISEVIRYVNNEDFDEEKNRGFEKVADLISDEIISKQLASSLFEKRNEFHVNQSELERLKMEKIRIDKRINEIKMKDDNN